MKHGPIALIDEDLPVVAVAADDGVFEKALGNIQEAKARGGRMIVVTNESSAQAFDEILHEGRDTVLTVPDAHPLMSAGADGDSAAVARVSRRDPARMRRRSAEESGEKRDGGVDSDRRSRSRLPGSPISRASRGGAMPATSNDIVRTSSSLTRASARRRARPCGDRPRPDRGATASGRTARSASARRAGPSACRARASSAARRRPPAA